MADIETLRLRLTQAENALHQVAIGRSVELVSEDGSTVRYAKANQDKLELYIRRLQGQIDDLLAPVAFRRRGPVQFTF